MTTRKKNKENLDLTIYGKVPPNARDLEMAILGLCLLEKDIFDLVIAIISTESFYQENHKIIFDAMKLLSQKSQPIDLLTVTEELIKMQKLEEIGGAFYVAKLTNGVVMGTNVEFYCRIVHEKFILRELIRIGGEAVQLGYDESSDAFDALNTCEKSISEISNAGIRGNVSEVTNGLMKAVKRLEELRKLGSSITGIPTGFKEINRITHGWQKTDLIILAARPSVGKTAFALNIIRNAAVEKVPCLFFSLEMSEEQLINRLLSSESGINLENIHTGKMDDEQMKTLYTKAIQPISQMKIFIDDTPALNIFELRAKARRAKRRDKIGLIVIDYLQLMSGGDSKNNNRESEIAKISRDLKSLAKELQVPIIALSQLSRKVEDRKGEKIPQLSDLRESGAIEQDADMVMFLYRPEYYDINQNENGDSNSGETQVRFAKNRHGKLETIKLKAVLSIQKFFDELDGPKEKKVSAELGKGNWKPVEETELF